MTLKLDANGTEEETSIRIKIWPVLMMIAVVIAWLVVGHFSQETRLCMTEKAMEKLPALETKLIRMHQEQDLYFTLRDPKWQEFKRNNLPEEKGKP